MTEVVDHFNRLLDLIDVERDAEQEENKRELDRWPVEMREALGKTASRLRVERRDTGIAGMPLLVLSRPPADEPLSPFHAMDQGDIVRVSFEDGPAFEGTLYDVEDYRVTVALNEDIPEIPPGRCEIDLLGSDATYQRMRRALSMARDASGRLAEIRNVLLGYASPLSGPTPDITFLDEGLNPYQRIAVQSALAADDVALVHGPPGTGKTTVLVEIIRQAVKNRQRVLATSPSNVAVDNILERLLFTNINVVRLGHPARTLESLRHATLMARMAEHPDQKIIKDLDARRERLSVQRFRRSQRGEGLTFEENKEIQKELRALWKEARSLERSLGRQIVQAADVVLVTHGGMGKLVSNERFDLAVMDEASQATEPLSWIPIVHSKKVVLAGDPLQLPPTIYSKEASEAGLSVTLMERLQKKLPDNLKTLLRIQYRMHETIMGFSSERFYDGLLEADASVKEHLAKDMKGVETTDITEGPLTYVDTAGAGFTEVWNELLDSRENEGEARLAVMLWEKIQAAGIRPEQAAIITPYNAQSKKLKALAPKGLEISSIDGFQGREKEVILLSLVRSNEKGEVGFLNDTRRMNVALTRARRLLIVIGDSATLGRHPFYNAFFDYVAAHGKHRSAWEWIS